MSSRNSWVARALDSFERPLVRYARRIVSDPETARDIVQDCFLKLCRQRQAKVEGHLQEWLFTVCRRGSIDHLRKSGRMSLLEDRDVVTHKTPVHYAEQREESGRIASLIGLLPARQQELLHLKFIEGFSYKQISAITKLTVSNVGFILHTALKKLRAELIGATHDH